MFVYLLILAGLLCLVVYNTLGWPRIGGGDLSATDSVSILIPARDEELHISPALDSGLLQGDIVKEVLVYDDHCQDRTAELVRDAQSHSAKVRLIPPADLPPGWCGKPFACARLAAQARGTWLLFLDADARLQPGAVARIQAEAVRRNVALLSCWPGLNLRSFWERALMPMLNFVVFTLFPAPLSIRSKLPALGLAHGACIFIRRDAYEATGGHAMVRGELFEDTALARAWRRAGQSGLCLDGQDVVRVRMYDSGADIWTGFQKNTYPAFRHEISFWLFLMFHAAFFLAPFALVFFTRTAWLAVSMVVFMRLIQSWRFRYPAWSALLHPVAEAGLIAVSLRSWFRCRFGAGVEWKGRSYPGRQGGAAG